MPYYYWGAPSAVKRSLYMGDVLYTISSEKILMTDLGDMTTYPAGIFLPKGGPDTWYGYPGVEPVPATGPESGVSPYGYRDMEQVSE